MLADQSKYRIRNLGPWLVGQHQFHGENFKLIGHMTSLVACKDSKFFITNRKMASNIVKFNVGGQIFQTTVLTLTKYSESMLAAMFNYEDIGMSPMPKTEEGHFFLDADPDYFKIILNWLRYGKITTDDPCQIKGGLISEGIFTLDLSSI